METRRAAGFSRQKLGYTRLVAEAIEAGGLPINTLSRKPDDEGCALFTATPGVGHWTADCYLMLALKRLDHWPVGNRALVRALQALKGLQERPGPERLDELGEHYRPYRSVATH
ncbi:HhH-GPD base excision DNA repair family protein [Pseudohaliea rubra DSM 19751]|uniref:HhH-GPD base excision DNA repair family protein n=2 Tax=Pseudohaliea TaxID=1341120 RepID=A0A095X223_9GAMM|nr:HhH-GPD base excision DNA repair family protein [Pseudohaliea rubra DSM 19751]